MFHTSSAPRFLRNGEKYYIYFIDNLSLLPTVKKNQNQKTVDEVIAKSSTQCFFQRFTNWLLLVLRHLSVVCCWLAEAAMTFDTRMTLIRCVMCDCSVHSVWYESRSVQPTTLTNCQYSIPSRGKRQLSCQRRTVGCFHNTPAYVSVIAS